MQSVETYSGGGWNAIAEKVTGRSAHACCQRWLSKGHYLRSSSKTWTKNEERALVRSVKMNGGKNWTAISENVPGRTTKSCKNHWHKIKQKEHMLSEEGITVDDEEGLNEYFEVDHQLRSDEIEIVQV